MKTARLFIALALTLGLALTAVAQGESVQEGNLIVRFDGGISPHSLPRSEVAPVTVKISTTIETSDGVEPPPQLRKIAIGINRKGKIFDRGLPTCRVRKIQPTTIAAAQRICGGAIVGKGHVGVRVHLPNQPPFTFTGPMLVFNAKPTGGDRRLLAQVYGRKPPSAFVLTFKVKKRPGEYGNQIRTTLPKPAQKWAYVTHFDMTLRRIYTYEGQRHSFISAGCPAPEGFPGGIYKFAKGTFTFGSGRSLSSTLIRDCKVR
ncbi:MAG TPA: hypothetical protein VFT10_02530 [Solirubrobacterales bacterium]|nr:hypothetical protein [Solirubrobacterales bacterium]